MRLRTIAALLSAAAVSLPAIADEYGKHPFYLHALTDLRAASWQIDHRRPEDGLVFEDEQVIHDEIRVAIGDLRRAAWHVDAALGAPQHAINDVRRRNNRRE